MVGVGISEGMLETAVTFKCWISLGDPEVMPDKAITSGAEFALTTTLFRASKVGGRLGLTVTLKVRVVMLLLVPPSLTVTVMMVVPLVLMVGLKVNVPVALGLV